MVLELPADADEADCRRLARFTLCEKCSGPEPELTRQKRKPQEAKLAKPKQTVSTPYRDD